MPNRPRRYVPGHAPSALEYEATPWRKADKAFYNSARWKRFRLLMLATSPLCRDHEAQGKTEIATEVHHAIKRKDRPDLAFDPDNTVPLCTTCHSKRTARGE